MRSRWDGLRALGNSPPCTMRPTRISTRSKSATVIRFMPGRILRLMMNSCSRPAGRLRVGLIALGCVLAFPLPHPARAAAAFPPPVRDALGRQVTIPSPPRRITSVAPSVTEILFALGLGDNIVGISDADDYPAGGLRGKTRVGGVILNVERILALRPDLVIGVAGLPPGQLGPLVRRGALGGVPGRGAGADRLVGGLRARVAAVERRVRGRVPPRVYVEIWDEPLQTAGAGTFIDDLVRRAGGRNLMADLHGWPQVAPEAVVRRDPEVILLTYAGRQRVAARVGWAGVAAVRRSRIYELDPDLVSRPGPRLGDGLGGIARLLHPAAVSPPW